MSKQTKQEMWARINLTVVDGDPTLEISHTAETAQHIKEKQRWDVANLLFTPEQKLQLLQEHEATGIFPHDLFETIADKLPITRFRERRHSALLVPSSDNKAKAAPTTDRLGSSPEQLHAQSAKRSCVTTSGST